MEGELETLTTKQASKAAAAAAQSLDAVANVCSNKLKQLLVSRRLSIFSRLARFLLLAANLTFVVPLQSVSIWKSKRKLIKQQQKVSKQAEATAESKSHNTINFCAAASIISNLARALKLARILLLFLIRSPLTFRLLNKLLLAKI